MTFSLWFAKLLATLHMSKQPQSASQKPLHDELHIVKRCALCNVEYDTSGLAVVEENDEARIVHLTCQACQYSMVACIMRSPAGLSSVGMVTDLTAKDLVRLRKKQPVTSEDVLNLHQYLTKSQQFISQFSN